jgi:hypothetical protein
MFGWLFGSKKRRRHSSFLPACDFSLQTFGHRARFYPASAVFQNSLVGKASKTFSFQHVRLMEPNIPTMLDGDAGLSASVLFSEHLVAKASGTLFLSLVQLIQPKIPAMLERDQAESVPHQ